jgi:hypothetical protein
MDRAGKIIIAPRYSLGLEFLEGRAPVFGSKKWRYIDGSGEPAFPGEFSSAERFSEGLAYVIAVPRRYGFINVDGKIVVEARYRWAGHFSEGRALVYAGKHAGFIDPLGNEVIPLRFDAGLGFSEGLAAVRKEANWGYIDRAGEISIPLQFERPCVAPFRDGFAVMKDPKGNVGFIDRTGTMAIQPRFQFTYGFSEGLAAVQVGERWGYIDRAGEFIIRPQFARAYPFAEGLAAVEVKAKSDEALIGFITPSGEFAIGPRFILGFRFHDGICWTETNETCGYVDRYGDYIWQCSRLQTNMLLRL